MALEEEGFFQTTDGYVYGWLWENGDWTWWSTLELAQEFNINLAGRPGVLYRRRYDLGEVEPWKSESDQSIEDLDEVEDTPPSEPRKMPSTLPLTTYANIRYRDSYGGSYSKSETSDDLNKVNGIGSRLKNSPELHVPIFDIDVPATLIPSSTEGHSHLYIDVPMTWRTYRRLLKECGRAGIVDKKFVKVSIREKMGLLRAPWVKKEEK